MKRGPGMSARPALSAHSRRWQGQRATPGEAYPQAAAIRAQATWDAALIALSITLLLEGLAQGRPHGTAAQRAAQSMQKSNAPAAKTARPTMARIDPQAPPTTRKPTRISARPATTRAAGVRPSTP